MRIENASQVAELQWQKSDGLLPAIVQDAFDGTVLMQAFMNREALEHTLSSGKVTFFSRSRQQLWTKGETSGNFLELSAVHADCDNDSLLVFAKPQGSTCHRGTASCFDDQSTARSQLAFLSTLEQLVAERDQQRPAGSYTTSLLESGVRRIAQKIGEEGVETALAASNGDDEEVCNESADLLYHLLVMLRARSIPLSAIVSTLQQRHS